MNSEKKNKYKVLQPLFLGLAMAIGMVLGAKMQNSTKRPWIQKVDKNIAPIGNVEELIRFIDHKYIDTIHSDHLVRVATQAVMNELDPYSEYIEAESDHSLEKSLNGLNEGIGVEEIEYEGHIYVYNVFPQSSAAEQKVTKGDIIHAFNGFALSDSLGKAKKIAWFKKAKVGDQCEMTFIRNFGQDTIAVKLTKNYGRFINPTSSYLINDNTCYVGIDQFKKDSYRRFMKQYEKLYDEKPFDNLILDIRDNTGGYVQDAINIANQFFSDKDKLLLTTVDKSGEETVYNSTGRSFFNHIKLVLLINEQTASSSEILASIIQDWDKGTIIGEPSFGKGLIQEHFPLNNGDVIKLSVSKYITPLGRIIFNDTLGNADLMDIEYKSKKEKRILKSGKIIPEIIVDPSPLTEMGVTLYVDAILDRFIFQNIYQNPLFKENFPISSSLDPIVDLIIDEINSYSDEKIEFSEKEINEIVKIANNNYIKHTEPINIYQSRVNKSDPFIIKALEYFEK